MFLRYAFIVLASILAANALAAPATSCPPLGALPGYLDAEPSDDLRAFNTFDFMTPSENDTSAVTGVSGRYCAQSLNIAEGVQPMSDLEIQSNYRSLLDALGATYFVKEENRTVAKVVKDGKETWIDAYSGEHWIETCVVQRTPHVFSLTTPGASDHAAFGHMPGYTVDNPERRNFAQHEFYLRDGEDTASVNIQGKFHFGSYYIAEGAPLASDADILENHRSVIKKLGGEILLAESNRTTGRYPGADGAPVWVEVSSGEHWYELRVVEEKPFQASITAPQASMLKAALDSAGRVALYINFDFGKATLRPDAKPVLDQIVALLKDDTGLTLAIEGHTDDIGNDAANQRLSEERARAVMAALTAGGIEAPRLSAAGLGESTPIAANDGSEGRAKNRRVELVKQ